MKVEAPCILSEHTRRARDKASEARCEHLHANPLEHEQARCPKQPLSEEEECSA